MKAEILGSESNGNGLLVKLAILIKDQKLTVVDKKLAIEL